jgi:hypothetical protein
MGKQRINMVVVAILLAVMISTLFSFFFFKALDDNSVSGTNTSIWVSDMPSDMSKDVAINVLQDVAHKYNTNLFLNINASNSGGNGKDLYAFIGNQELYNESFPNNISRDFSPNWKTRILKPNDIGYHSLIGSYSLNADKVKLNEVINYLSAKGMSVRASDGLQYSALMLPAVFVFTIFTNKLHFLFISLIAGLFFVLMYSNAKKSKQFSIQITSGFSKSRILKKELVGIVKIYLLAVSATIIATMLFLRIYNSWNKIGEFMKTLSFFYLVLLVVILLFDLLAIVAVSIKPSFTELINGRKHNKFIITCAVLTEILIFALVFTAISASISNYKIYAIDAKKYESFAQAKTYNAFILGPEIRKEGASEKFGSLIKNLDESGYVMFCERARVNLGDLPIVHGSTSGYAPSNSMIVNNVTLDMQGILDISSNPIKNLSDDGGKKIYVLIPEKLKNIEKRILEASKRYIVDELTYYTNNKPIIEESKIPSVNVIYTKNNQTISNFNDGRDYNNGPLVDPSVSQVDPIIMVIPRTYKIISKGEYTSRASSSEVYVSDKADINKALTVSGAGDFVTAVNNVYDSMSEKTFVLKTYQTLSTIGIVFSLIVLLFASMILVLVYSDKNKQITFAKYVNGYSFWNTHMNFVLITAIVPLVLLLLCSLVVKPTMEGITVSAIIILGNTFASAMFLSGNTARIKSETIKQV